jgi:voltage-gated potassium channel Kch
MHPRNLQRMQVDVEKRFQQWYERLTLFRAVRTILLVAVLLVLLAGALERIVEPDTFTSLGLAYWWAVVTVTTVGYGDIVPESVPGRIVGSMLMLLGISLIPTLTSVVVSTFIGKQNRAQREQIERQGQELAATLERIEANLARLSDDGNGGGERRG